jgi:hypothetical protein
MMRAPGWFATTALVSQLLTGCAYNKEAIHPSDVLQTSAGRSIVLLSTSSASQSVAFAKALVISRVDSEGKRIPVITYSIDSPWEQADIPQDNTNLRWVALEPGNYAIDLGIMNVALCFTSGPEFYFTAGRAEHLYLGNFHPAATSLHVSNVMARDVAYFQYHAKGGERTTFEPLPLEMKMVDYACDHHKATPIQVFMDRG